MSLPEHHRSDELLRVAILTASVSQAAQLKKQLYPHHINIVHEERFNQWDAPMLPGCADVLLVEQSDEEQVPEPVLEILLEQIDPPVLFNDSATARFTSVRSGEQVWGRKLAEKLRALAYAPRPKPRPRVVSAPPRRARVGPPPVADRHATLKATGAGGAPALSGTARVQADAAVPLTGPAQASAVTVTGTAGQTAVGRRIRHQRTSGPVTEVWVLGASIGGPQVVKEFFSAFTHTVPAIFVLAQHIGSGFIRLLAEQLNHAGALNVEIARDGQELLPGHVYVAPVEHDLGLTPEGRWQLHERQFRGLYAPSIDAVMQVVSEHFADTAHAMVFSGMGGDALEGCRSISQSGGEVWVQEPRTCVVSAMVDNIRQQGLETFTGAPVELARQLTERLSNQSRTAT